MKINKKIALIMMSILPLLTFGQGYWDDIYSTSSSNKKEKTTKETTINTVSKRPPVTNKKQVLVVKNNGDVVLETVEDDQIVYNNGQSQTVDVDAYNRRYEDENYGRVVEDTIYEEPYEDFQYTDRIVRYHNPENSFTIRSNNDINVSVVNDMYGDYYRHRGWNFNVGLGWWGLGYRSWYDPWYYYPSYHYSSWCYYDPW